MTTFRFTDEQKAEIVDRYRSSESLRSIARDFGCSAATIHNRVIRQSDAFNPGHRPKSLPHKFSDAERAEILTRYTAGESLASLAPDYGCSPQTVHTHVIKLSDVFVPGRKKQRYSDEQKQEMVDRYQAGESLKALGRHYGCSAGNVRWIVLARGVQLRPEGRPVPAPATLELVRTRRAAGVSHQRIADELGVREHTVLTWCRDLLLPIDSRSGPKNPSWKGGRVIHRGYIRVKIYPPDPLAIMADSSSYVPEHRLVVARSLGRPLTSSETVHHRNGDKEDNRLENLQLRQGNHGNGVRMQCMDCGSHNIGHPEL